MNGYTYLASPYSHPDPAIRQQRFEAACKMANLMMRDGTAVYSPIAHGHPIDAVEPLPATWEFWKRPSFVMLDRADEVYVLDLPGWKESTGVRAEVERALYRGIPVYVIDHEQKKHVRPLKGSELDELRILHFETLARDEPESILRDLLAVMHGDGGHRTEEIGLKRSAIEAIHNYYERKK